MIIRISKVLLFAMLVMSYVCNAQQNDITFLVNKIKTDYAGYSSNVKSLDFEKYYRKVCKEDRNDTFRMLSRIVDFFHDPHLQLYAFNTFDNTPVDTEACRSNSNTVRDYLTERKFNKGQYEGYWVNDFHTMVIAIKKVTREKKKVHYDAYLMEIRNRPSIAGTLMAKMELIGSKVFLTDYTNLSGTRLFVKSEFKNDSVLTMGDLSKWRKLNHYIPGQTLNNLSVTSGDITGALLDVDNYLITIPDFSEPNNLIVDSIVKADSNKIASAKNLIIDIRDNSGGSVKSYSALLPFIYTKPIVTVGGYHLCSDDIIRHYEDLINDLKQSGYPESQKIARLETMVAKLKLNRGKFLFEPGDTVKFDKVLPKPLNVAIITNYACQSASEMMLLDCKQSSKVTIFGEHTMGAVDYLNFFPIELPSGKYTLYLATFKRYIAPCKKKLDGVGIYPDVPIADNIPDWVEFVQSYYSNKH